MFWSFLARVCFQPRPDRPGYAAICCAEAYTDIYFNLCMYNKIVAILVYFVRRFGHFSWISVTLCWRERKWHKHKFNVGRLVTDVRQTASQLDCFVALACAQVHMRSKNRSSSIATHKYDSFARKFSWPTSQSRTRKKNLNIIIVFTLREILRFPFLV